LQQQTFDGVVAGDEYGRSVSSAGDVNGDGFDDVIIGAPKNNAGGISSGRAYIFFGGAIINNSVDVILTGGAVSNYFGISVSSAGDVNSDGYDDVIVGAYGYNSFTGRAYVYFGGASMNSVADVFMTGEFTGHNFGSSVSGAGDANNDGFSDVIIGAYGSNSNTGKAYVFYGGVSMNNIADVTFTGETSQSYFGSSVSGAGDVNGDGYHDVIIGAYGYNSDIGKAYIYFGGASMDNISDVNMFGGAIVDFFGASVSNAGDVNDDGYSDVIVGAYGSNSNTGRAYIFYGSASMNGVADVTMTGEATNNLFAYSVSDAGDVNGDGFADVFVGAWGFSTSNGRAYLYYGGANMNNAVDIFMTGETAGNYFGYSVSGGGDVNGDGYSDMIAGAFGYNSSTGRAYVYTNTLRGEDIADLEMKGEAQYDYFGVSVSSAGDVNRDGYNDVIIGALGYNNRTGRAYIFYGEIIMDNIPDVILTGESINSEFGASVSSAGDVNGDGFDDVIVGADAYSSFTGRAYVFYGGAVMNNVADVICTGSNTYELFGWSVSGAGDVNDDGFSDLIVSSLGYSNTGSANIYFGGTSMDNTADVIMTGETAFGDFGVSVSEAGDVNGDSYSDVIVGDDRYNSNTGRAYLYYGGVTMNNIVDVTFTGTNNSYMGYSVSGAGDVNGDGYSDVIVGANNPAISLAGSAFIYFGSVTMNNIADVIFTGNGNSPFGTSVSGAGDVNRDGFSDVIIGRELSSSYLYFGSVGMDNVSDITLKGQTGDVFGASLSGAGDINGDGYDDVVVGAWGMNNNIGGAFVYLSSPPDNRKNLFLFGAIQGMYDPVLDIEVPDTIKVYLRNSTSPFARVDSSKNILLGPGTGQQFLFRNAQNVIPYYVEVTHRNALTTWSANHVAFVNSDASIAFSVDAVYAFGNNEIQVDNDPYNVFAFYSGDINQDGTIDASDVSEVDNDSYNSLSGYVNTDVTGDDFVDAADVSIVDNNSFNAVSVVRP
ncbi:MAG: FG-GAP-like repeat-containing protein, partial [Ignavibacteria bacterium]